MSSIGMYQHQKGSRVRRSLATAAFLMILMAVGCKDNRNPYARFEPAKVNAQLTSDSLYAVVEIPAGTTVLQRLDTARGLVITDQRGTIDFLPFPGNYGFLSSTLNEGRPLNAMILMHALAEESVISVIPIGVLQMRNTDGPFEVVICVPANPKLRSIKVTRFTDFITDYESARHILQEWFLNYMGFGSFELVGWQDERFAADLIQRYRILPE